MATAEVAPGACCLATKITVGADGDTGMVTIALESQCEGVRRLAAALPEADGHAVAFTPAARNPVYLAAEAARLHPACVVPAAIIKAVEVACGLALPRDVSIKLAK